MTEFRGGQEEDKRRTRPSHRAQPQSPAELTEFRGVAKRGGQGPATEPSHRAQPQSSGARPVSVASSFLSKIEPPTVNCLGNEKD